MGIGVMMLPLARTLGWMRTSWYYVANALAWVTALLSLSPGIGGLLLARGWWEWKKSAHDPRRLLFGRLALAVGFAGALIFFVAPLVELAPRGGGVNVLGTSVEPSPRVLLWTRAVETVAAHPVIGQGLGTDLVPVEYTAANGDRERAALPGHPGIVHEAT